METTNDVIARPAIAEVDPSGRRLRRVVGGIALTAAVVLLYVGAMVGLAGH